MTLNVGAVAPDLETRDMFEQPVSLAALRGRPVLLSFMRYASCPMCNLRVRQLALAHESLAREGLVILVVFQSSAERMRQYVGRQDAPFALIPDPQMIAYHAFHVETGWLGLLAPSNAVNAIRAFSKGFRPGHVDGPVDRLPADFLIDRDGRIGIAFYARAAGEHLPLEAVTTWLERNRPTASSVQTA
ncbi:redoxin domain-containing protein [Niveibacterium sp.]|uniref:redoxin domain-containing protein n=1 Tax=Niveibacterium sp. TaxID=2017444 RepID=UPI0035AE5F8F